MHTVIYIYIYIYIMCVCIVCVVCTVGVVCNVCNVQAGLLIPVSVNNKTTSERNNWGYVWP